MAVLKSALGEIPLVEVSGDLDHCSAPGLVEQGLEQVSSGGDILLIDLGGCFYLDSGGVGALLRLLRVIRPHGSLGVIGANVSVTRVIRAAGLLEDPAFRLFADREEAAAMLGRDNPSEAMFERK